jgi:hypothetical protein
MGISIIGHLSAQFIVPPAEVPCHLRANLVLNGWLGVLPLEAIPKPRNIAAFY